MLLSQKNYELTLKKKTYLRKKIDTDQAKLCENELFFQNMNISAKFCELLVQPKIRH